MKRKLTVLIGIMAIMIVIVFATAFFINKGKKEDIRNDEAAIRVVTSFYPTYVLTINLTDGISDIKVDSLTDFTAGCLHDYQLTTNDMRLLSNADVFIINGGGMEEYLDDVIESYPHLQIINLSQGITMLDSEVHHGGDNPHVWLDPDLYMMQIENGRAGLEQYIENIAGNYDLNEDINNDYYKEVIERLNSNANTYLEDVAVLADEMNIILANVKDMVQNRNISNKVVVFHDSFAYLSNKAGLEVAYTIELDEDTPLSAGQVAEVVDAIRRDSIPYLFTEEQYDDTISDRIKEETEARVYVIDSAVTGNAAKDSYLIAMRRNIETLKKAFAE